MTHEEREAEAQRLMAILQGDGEPTLITETGELQTATDDGPYCQYCQIDLVDDDIELVEGETYCTECALVVRWLRPLQVTCRICEGKRLIYAPVTVEGARYPWHPCPACKGKRWEHGHIVFDMNSEVGQQALNRVHRTGRPEITDEVPF